jgi:hypothetical protein
VVRVQRQIPSFEFSVFAKLSFGVCGEFAPVDIGQSSGDGPEQIDAGAGRFPADQLESADRADLSELTDGMDSDFAEPAAALRAEIAERFKGIVRFHCGGPAAPGGGGEIFLQKTAGTGESSVVTLCRETANGDGGCGCDSENSL